MSRIPLRPAGGTLTLARMAWWTLLILLLFPAEGQSASCLTTEPLYRIRTGGETALRQPSDMAAHDDQLFVLDDLNGRVVRFSLDGSFLGSIPLPGGSRTSYLGIDLGGDDNLYLASSGKGKIVVITQSGSTVREFPTGAEGGSSEPVGVNVSRGTCFVVDNEEHKVKAFDLDGTLLEQWGSLGERPLDFRYPFRVIQDNAGRVIVSDSLNSRIKIFTPKGELLFDFGEFGVVEGTLFRPAGLTLWGDELVLVADNYLGSIQLFNLKGTYRATLCGSDGVPLLFRNPVSLAVRGTTVFVLEMGAGQVQALKLREPAP